MDTLIVASNNAKKIKELRGILASLAPGMRLVDAAAVGLLDIPETGTTFAANALLKAVAAYEHTGLISLADDSGLEVDALDGAPGVYSARYAGPGALDADNNRKLQEAMREVPSDRRGARYRCVIALVAPLSLRASLSGATVIETSRGACVALTVEGACEVRVLSSPSGGGGFGYDPYMLYEPAGKTFAELTPDEKSAVSHRGQALRALGPHLAALVPR